MKTMKKLIVICNIINAKKQAFIFYLSKKTNIQKNYPSLNFCQQTITVPTTNLLLTPLLVAPAFQLLSYEVAKLRGLDIDKPRNLAKSVTVEQKNPLLKVDF